MHYYALLTKDQSLPTVYEIGGGSFARITYIVDNLHDA